MEIAANTPTAERTIAGLTVNVPQPYAEGQPLTAETAAILNQTFAENISNNTRAKLAAGYVATEGAEAQAHDSASAQRVIDEYIAGYEPGVRRGGSGEPRVTDPVEKEARALAREKAKEHVKSQGQKPSDVDMPALSAKIFEAYRDHFMGAAAKIVAARTKQGDGLGLDFSGIELTAKAEGSETTEG